MASEWRRGSFSNGTGGSNCVELSSVYEGNTDVVCGVAIRDSKDPDGHILVFTLAEWEAFRLSVEAGEFRFQGAS